MENKRQRQSLRLKALASIENVSLPRKGRSRLELLPNELLHEIYLLSMNINLSLASSSLANALDNHTLNKRFLIHAFGSSHGGYHDSNPCISEDERIKLQDIIMRRNWFTAELFFSCQREYFIQAIPDALVSLTGDERHATTTIEAIDKHVQKWREDWNRTRAVRGYGAGMDFTPWPFFNNWKTDGEGPNFQPLLDVGDNSLKLVNPRIFTYINFVSYSEAMSTISWALRNNQYLPESRYFIRFPSITHISRPWPSGLLNPEVWTMQHLAMLLSFRDRDDGLNTFNPESADALSDGLMRAIQQKFLPAVFIISKPMFKETATRETLDRGQKWISRVCQEMRDCESEFPSKSWAIKWQHRLASVPRVPRQRCFYVAKPSPVPTIGEHLIEALKVAIQSGADIEVYFSFCWLSVSFILNVLKKNHRFPEDTFLELQNLALQHVQDEPMVRDCWEFFNEAIDDIWGTRSRRPQWNRRIE